MTAALAAAMLGVGVAVGAAIGPAPTSSFAIGKLVPLLPALSGSGDKAAAKPAAVTPAATPSPSSEASSTPTASSTTSATPAPATTPAASEPTSTTPSPSTGTGKTSTIAPVTHVWLIELNGAGFGEAQTQASAAPYIDGAAISQGTLLSGWSAIAGSAFASDAAALAQPAPQLLTTIVQPPCPEGAAGATCAPGTPGAVTAADEFLKATLPTITGTGPYRENGLVAVTFTTVSQATATGLPAGASSATLTAEPPAGVLLISPFAAAGQKSSVAFDPASPKQSLEKLLRR